jgi:hypothetical protein
MKRGSTEPEQTLGEKWMAAKKAKTENAEVERLAAFETWKITISAHILRVIKNGDDTAVVDKPAGELEKQWADEQGLAFKKVCKNIPGVYGGGDGYVETWYLVPKQQ